MVYIGNKALFIPARAEAGAWTELGNMLSRRNRYYDDSRTYMI